MTKRARFFIIAAVALWILSIAIVLHNQEIIVAAWQSKPVTNFSHVANYTYEAFLDKNDLSPPSSAMLFEDSTALGPGNSNAPSISCLGRGRYQFRYDRLHFSTSDNTDPMRNGRYYTIKWPYPIPPPLRWLIFGLTIAVTAISVRGLDYLRGCLRQRGAVILSISFGIVIVSFLITRLPYLIYYPVVSIHPDTVGYFEIVSQMDKGQMPSLYLRPPGYPLFMKLVFLISNKLFSLVIAQAAMSLLSSLVFVYAVFKAYRRLAISAALALAAFISSHVYLEAEISILSESIYVSVLVLAFGFLIMALRLRKSLYFILFSAAAAYSIYIRPAGMFFIPIVVVIVIYAVVNHYKRRHALAIAVPFGCLLVTLASYNLLTFHTFSLSNYGELTTLVGMSTFLEEDGSYSKELNEAIRKIRARSTPVDRDILETSWSPEKFDRAMFNAYNAGGDGGIIGPISEAAGNPPQKRLLSVCRGLYLDIARKNPYKFFRKTFIIFLAYHQNTSKEHEFYSTVNTLYNDMYVQKNTLCNTHDDSVKAICKEYSNPQPLAYFSVQDSGCGGIVNYIPTFIQQIHYKIFSKLHKFLFRSLFWPILNLIIFIMSAFYLVRFRLRYTGAFILFIMSSSALLSALIVGLSTFPNVRYTYTTEFIYYAVAALAPILWKDELASDGQSRY